MMSVRLTLLLDPRTAREALGVEVRDYGGHAEIFLGDREVGFINYNTGNNGDFPWIPVERHEVYLRYMNVHFKARNRGVGSQALREFERLLRAKGITKVSLHPNSARASRFWRRNGFVSCRRVKPSLLCKAL
jgi:GNAT superfamily N-acetyltransferase